MKNKIIILLALVFGIITAVLTMNYLNNIKQAIDNTEYVQIVAAKQDIAAKTMITEAMVEKKTIPLKYKHEKEIIDDKKVVGKIALIPIYMGESILENHLAGIGDSNDGLSYNVPQGYRAMTVAVDSVSGIAGLIKVGDRVDVTATIDIGEDPSITYSLVVLQDVKVLAIDRIMDANTKDNSKAEEVKTVTLAVSLDDSIELKMASDRGKISILLRSPIDNSKSTPVPFKAEDFLRNDK